MRFSKVLLATIAAGVFTTPVYAQGAKPAVKGPKSEMKEMKKDAMKDEKREAKKDAMKDEKKDAMKDEKKEEQKDAMKDQKKEEKKDAMKDQKKEEKKAMKKDEHAEHKAFETSTAAPKKWLAGVPKLTKAERTQINAIETKYRTQIATLKKDHLAAEKAGKDDDSQLVARVQAIVDQERAEIRAALTADQQARFDANVSKMK